MKHKSRRYLAGGLVQQLVDLDIWLESNVIDDKKKKLDAVDKDYDTAWYDCVTSIDSRGRDIKRRMKTQGKL